MITAVYSYMMYKKKQHQQVWSLLYTRTCVMFFFVWVGILRFMVRTYLVCVASSRLLYCECVPRIILSSRATTTSFSSPYTQNNISYFGGMYQKQQHHQQAWSLLYTRTCVMFFWGGLGSCPLLYVPRVCRVIPCPILLVRAWYHTVFSCDNNSALYTLH